MSLENKSERSNLSIDNGIIISVLSNKSYIREVNFRNHHKHKRKKFCFLCRSQTNSLLLIIGAYLVIFLIASVILILSVLKLQNHDNEKLDVSMKSGDIHKVRHASVLKSYHNLLSDTYFKEFVWPYRSSLFNCSNLSEVQKFKYLTSGWTKNVFSFEYGRKNYALKTVNLDGIDMKNCMEKESNKVCFDKASSKMYKEYILSRELSHPNIVKVLAWCVSSSNYTTNVAIVSELCSSVDLISILRMSFEQRLKIMLDLSTLMAYLSESPLGSVAINDFQRQQFVMCGNVLKLTDMDDLSIEEPRCIEDHHCLLNTLRDSNHTQESNVKCNKNVCDGFNERKNLRNTYKHFVNLFLNITTPGVLKKDVENLMKSYELQSSAKIVLRQTEELYSRYNDLKTKKYNMSIF